MPPRWSETCSEERFAFPCTLDDAIAVLAQLGHFRLEARKILREEIGRKVCQQYGGPLQWYYKAVGQAKRNAVVRPEVFAVADRHRNFAWRKLAIGDAQVRLELRCRLVVRHVGACVYKPGSPSVENRGVPDATCPMCGCLGVGSHRVAFSYPAVPQPMIAM